MSAFEQLKDKLAYFGGYKWLPYVDAVELVNENQYLKSIISQCRCEECGNELGNDWDYTDMFGILCNDCKIE